MVGNRDLSKQNVGFLRPTLISDGFRIVGQQSDRPRIRRLSDSIRINCRTRKPLENNDLRRFRVFVRPSDANQAYENKISGSGNGDAASSGWRASL